MPRSKTNSVSVDIIKETDQLKIRENTVWQ